MLRCGSRPGIRVIFPVVLGLVDDSSPTVSSILVTAKAETFKRIQTPSKSSMSPPKAVIFDLGGVLITSPLKAIEEYESENNIPSGYINFAMSLRT
jgi:hypothetical protein